MGRWQDWRAARPLRDSSHHNLVLSEKSPDGLPLYLKSAAPPARCCSLRQRQRRRRCHAFSMAAIITFTLLFFLTHSSQDPAVPGGRLNWLRCILSPSWHKHSIVPEDSRAIGSSSSAQAVIPEAGLAATTALSQSKKEKPLIPLEAHIMSKCPDARDCLQDLILPAMSQIASHINFTLSFIGTVESDSSVNCKHGPSECLGNMLDLCAALHYPASPLPTRSLGFANCLTAEYGDIPKKELIEKCANESGMEFETLNSCVSEEGEEGGLAMLVRSVERSADLGVTKSCTVRLNEETWCIRDGGEGCEGSKGMDALVEAVEELYNKQKW